jgi:hypothetical protein
MAGVYEALSRGIESGYGMARQADLDKQNREQTTLQNERQRQADMRAEEDITLRRDTEKRQQKRLDTADRAARVKEGIAAAEAEIADIEKTAAARQLQGMPVDPEDAKRYGTLRAQLKAERQESLDFFSRVETEQTDIGEATPKDLYLHWTRATGMLPEDVQKMPQHIADIQSGLETGNPGLQIKGVNGLLGPTYLRRGIGEPSPHGGTITRKEIVNLVPARGADGIDHPDKVFPIVRVYVQTDDGSEKYYDAPLTRNGTTEANDAIVPLDLKRGFDYMGQMGTLATAAQSPQIATKLAQGAQEAGPEAKKYLDDLTARTKPVPKDATTQKIEAVRRYATENNISFDEAAKRLQTGGLLPGAPKQQTDADKRLIEARIAELGSRAAKNLTGGAEPTLSPDTQRKMAEQYLSGDKGVMQNLGRGAQGAANVVALRETIARVAEGRGLSGADIAAKQSEFMGMNAAQRALGTRQANFGLAKSEAYEMADLVTETSQNVSRTQFMPINKALNAYNTNTGGTEIREFGAALNSFINAYARAISPVGTPTVSDKDHARAMLSTADSHEQVVAIMGQLKKEMEAAGRAPGIVKKEIREGFAKDNAGGGAKPAGAPKYQEGQTATGPNGAKMVFKGGKWQPLQ